MQNHRTVLSRPADIYVFNGHMAGSALSFETDLRNLQPVLRRHLHHGALEGEVVDV